VRAVGVQGAEVLEEEQLAPRGEYGREHGGDQPVAIDRNAGGGGDVRVLTHRAQLLAEARALEEEIECAYQADERERDDRNAHRRAFERHVQLDEIVERVLNADEVDGVAQAVALGEQHVRRVPRNHAADREQEQELVEAVREEAGDEAGHHLAALRAIEQRAGAEAAIGTASSAASAKPPTPGIFQ